MPDSSSPNWFEANQRYLAGALERLRADLEQRAGGGDMVTPGAPEALQDSVADGLPAPPALVTLCKIFHLSSFEREILLLCAGMELDSRFWKLCAAVQDDPAKPFPTFSMALAILPGPHWSALSPVGPLRYWRMIDVAPGNALTQTPLRLDERILHYLSGTSYLDERLSGYVKPLSATGELVPSHEAQVKQMTAAWSRGVGTKPLPVIQLCGPETADKHNLAASACARLGMKMHLLPARLIPANPLESESLERLWKREAALSVSALLLECDGLEAEPGQEAITRRWIESADYPIIVSSRERRPIDLQRVISFEVKKPEALEQYELWRNALGSSVAQTNGQVNALVSHFSLNSRTINNIAAETLELQASASDELGRALWKACNREAHPRLGELAQRLEPLAGWDDLVLPEAQVQVLHDIARQVHQRLKVYETWGFAGKSTRGLGISALFAGVSGTGKTMAAEVLAKELELELYRIDLSQVVNKYIGETEKNLRRVFDAAEDSSAILLFDEADALFGKRSEVKDSHDRYANVEISYLLQRMEAYRGLAILTTNMKEALDQAFLRRLRFVVQFPFPDVGQRLEIWKRVFPAQTPTDGLDAHRLAQLSITGGNIRNMAMYAAFLAAEAGEPVRMSHLLRAARFEFAKLEKPLTDTEIGGWA
jgi:SpoVK/Ycf46/Vps4 family AAA+-type ATPase